jgi:peptidyl-prolyl cis-trans isomerase SurA
MAQLRYPFLSALLLCAAAGTACRASQPASDTPPAPDTWAVVNGQSIMRADVDAAFRRSHDPAQVLSDEELQTAKLEILNDLVMQELLLAKARELKIEVPANELDAAYENARRNIPDEAFQQELTRRGVTAAEMREGLRRELLAQKVVTQEVSSKTAVSEKEITDFFNANRAQFNVPEESYHIAQIVVSPQREPELANRTGDDATTPQEAADKVKMLMERLKAGAQFSDLAMGYSEDAETAPRGGDLGFMPVSRLKGLPPPLRDAVLGQKPGTVNVASAGGAHTLVLVLAHEQPGQRDLSTPAVRERITNTLRGRREQLYRTAYLTAARNDAVVVNYLAEQLLAAPPAAPALPAAPAAAPAAPK